MNEKLDQHGANLNSKRFLQLRLSARYGIVCLLLVMAIMVLPSSPAQAQGNRNVSAKVSNQKIRTKRAEGATITASRVTLKPGYEFKQVSDNKVAVVRMSNGGYTMNITCTCKKSEPKKSGSCKPKIQFGYVVCEATNCLNCGRTIVVKGVSMQ